MLAQVAGAGRANEQGQVDDLLEELMLTGLAVTADPIHTQAATPDKILDQESDYLVVVKEHQPALLSWSSGVIKSATQ